MDLSAALIIAALLALGRWVVRSLREPITGLPDAEGKAAVPRPARPGQKSGDVKATSASQKRAASRRASPTTVHADPVQAWNVVLDVPPDAPRAEIQAAAKRRIAQAISNGDNAAIATITRAAAAGMKNRLPGPAQAPPRGRGNA